MRPTPQLPVRRLLAAGAALALAFSLTACGGADDQDAGAVPTRAFKADNGTVQIPVDPQRVVATGYAVPVLLEGDADLVGISEWSRGTKLMTPADLKDYQGLKKVAGETAASINYEVVANLKPDLIVIGVPLPVLGAVDMDRLKKIAPVVVLGPSRPDSWTELSRRQSDAAGVLKSYDAAKQAYDDRVTELKAKYATVLGGLKFGHVGAYADATAGTFQREFSGSWGTNIADDLGVTYYGQVKKAEGGSSDVSETPAIEELPASLGEADVITYSLTDDGTPNESVKYVLDSNLWKGLPAVRAGKTLGLRFTEAATYPTALKTLEEIDTVFGKAFAKELS